MGGPLPQPSSDPAQGPGDLGLTLTIGPAPKQSLLLSLLSPYPESIKLLLCRAPLSGWSRTPCGRPLSWDVLLSLDLPLLRPHGRSPPCTWSLVKCSRSHCMAVAQTWLISSFCLELPPGSYWMLWETSRAPPWLWASVLLHSKPQKDMIKPLSSKATQSQTQTDLSSVSHRGSEQVPQPP